MTRGSPGVRRGALALLLAITPGCEPAVRAQAVPEVRQLVTFKFLPGSATEALFVYTRSLIPAYRDDSAMLRFRGYREVESPEPLDLVAVSSFEGLAGMDRSNADLRARPARNGGSIGDLYARVSALSQHHRDELVEVMPELTIPGERGQGLLWVFESVRVAPGTRQSYEELLGGPVMSWERGAKLLRASDSGRVLVGDGWDYMRFLAFDSLGDFHQYLAEARAQAFASVLDTLISARKRVIVREDPAFSVR